MGLLLGGLLDWAGLETSPLGNWPVRTLSGEGESLFEGIYALRRRLQRQSAGIVEAYGWGKLLGMTVPPRVDWGSRLAGVETIAVGGLYIRCSYGMSDQILGNSSGLEFLRRQHASWRGAAMACWRHPVIVAGLVLIVAVPPGLLALRSLGFEPRTQVLAALETIAANLCWLPPLVGSIAENRARRSSGGG